MPQETPRRVLLIGPDVSQVGGMATVVSQILSFAFEGRYEVASHPVTTSTRSDESFVRRVVRHVVHMFTTWRRLRRTKPALVHIHTCSGFSFLRSAMDLVMARCNGARVILHVHGAAFDAFCRNSGWLTRRGIQWILEQADAVVALSSHWAKELARVAPSARTVVVENAVATDEAPLRKPVRDGCRFLFLGRMDEWKGIDDLLRAAAQLVSREVRFELVLAGPAGTAGDARTLPERIRELGLSDRVRYVGSVQGEGKKQLFETCDAYVQPSHHEGMPISLLEALAHGLPVLATSVGAVPEVIRDGREGLLAPPRCVDRLAAGMIELALNPVRREAMSEAGRRLVRNRFSLQRFEEDLLALYDAMLTSKARYAGVGIAKPPSFEPLPPIAAVHVGRP